MTTILRERVACLFYAVEYTVENTKKYTKLIDEIEAVEICYTGNPKKPPPQTSLYEGYQRQFAGHTSVPARTRPARTFEAQ